MTIHPLADLSAYLDGALGAAAKAGVAGHLDSCGECRSRTADLKAVSRAVGALSGPVPTRSLLPRLGRPPAWLAPARTLATLGSGLFVFAFLVSGVLFIDPNMGGGGRGGLLVPREILIVTNPGVPAVAPAPAGEASATNSLSAPSAFAAGSAAPGAVAPRPSGPLPTPAAVAVRQSQQESAADAAKASSAAAPARAAEPARLALGPSPFVWLALALVCAAIALALRRRMRTA